MEAGRPSVAEVIARRTISFHGRAYLDERGSSPLEVGIGLPSCVPGTAPDLVLEWARRADEGAFSSLGVVDRLVYDCYEPMTTLAAAASTTRRVGLVTMVVISPLRNHAILAKEAATVDALSGGRLTLGVAVGARSEDFRAAGVAAEGRGDVLEDQLFDMRALWEQDDFTRRSSAGPGPPVLVGGISDVTFWRVARFADGYVHGGGPPRTFDRAARRTRTAWAEAGRAGSPRLWAQGYFALGDDDMVARGRDYVRDYYAFTGPFAERIAEGMLGTPQAIAQFVRGYREAGCEELVLLPAVAEREQLDRLEDVLAGL
jgi:alkanesulfonate monooxygenase SsuD/methylene tetrahydromethanopterin reductase-like flavin-dependent oxidoreductase (luciferase family)